MKKAIILRIGFAITLVLFCRPAGAQIVFAASDFPSQISEYFRGYISSDITVSGLPGATNGPQYWDFSYPQQSFENILRTDIVGPNDAGDGSTFSNAVYAERDTHESDGSQAWRYYRLANYGRLYYGFDDPVDDPVTPIADFLASNIEFPCPLQYGRTWSRTVDWNQIFFQEEIGSMHYTSQATVDAYGTVVLPKLGALSALRVNEVDTYINTTPGLVQTNIFRMYYWLVRGIGLAAVVISQPQTTVPPQNFTAASTTLRVFEASNPKDILSPVSDLRFQLGGGVVSLNWNAGAAGTSYRIETTDDLTNSSWQLFSLPSGNSWSGNFAPVGPRGYFRVFSKP